MLTILSYFHQPEDNDNVVDELIKELTLIGKLCFFFVVDTVRCIFNLAKLYLVFGIFIAVIFVLYITREVSLEVLHETGIITLDIADIIDTIVNGIIDVIKDIASGATFGAVDVPIDDIDLVGKLGAMQDAKNMINICDSVDTMWDEVFHTLKLNTKKVCAVVRYMYPVDFIYTPLYKMLGWSIFDPSPVGQPGCEPPRFYMLCYIFNFYRMAQFFAAAIFYYTIFRSYIRTINFFFEHFFFQILTLTLHAVQGVFTLLWHIITRKKHVHTIEDVWSELFEMA